MNTYTDDNIFDIFEDVLSQDNFSSFSTDPIPTTVPFSAVPSAMPCVEQDIAVDLPAEQNSTPSLGWTITNARQDVNISDAFCLIKVRSRDDEDVWNTVPEVMYSSLRYTMTISVDPSCLPDIHTPLILSQIRVVDDNGAEIKKNNGESVIKGPKEFQNLEISRETGRLECDITIKWQSVSFHHAKRKFAFQVSFFDIAEGTMNLLFETRSGSFLTYARRPAKSERVKKTPAADAVNTAICKKRKISVKKEEERSAYFHKFAALIEELVVMKENLPEQEKQLASKILRERLLCMKEALLIEDQN